MDAGADVAGQALGTPSPQQVWKRSRVARAVGDHQTVEQPEVLGERHGQFGVEDQVSMDAVIHDALLPRSSPEA